MAASELWFDPAGLFFVGIVEDKCYVNHPDTIEALKHEIEVAIHGIKVQTIENVLKKILLKKYP